MLLAQIAFLLAAVLPVFFGKLHAAPFWLCIQGLALAWNLALSPSDHSSHALFGVVELLAVRACLAPWLLRRTILRSCSADVDLMPSNLFAWTVAVALIVMAFEFGGAAVAESGVFALGVVGATVAIAFLVLATNDTPAVQWVALLFMENALTLFESLLPTAWPLPVHLALGVVYVLTLWVGAFLLQTPESVATAAVETQAQDPAQGREVP